MKKISLFRIPLLLFIIAICFSADCIAQRSETYSLNLSRIRSGYNHETKNSGFDFDRVQMRYQFVNCGGDVQMGINYDKSANYISYYNDGSSYYKSSIGSDLWPKSNDFELQEITADLYYGNTKLGSVHLNYIV